MIDQVAGHLVVKVPLVMANARGLLEAGRSALKPGEQVFDFSEVGEADSSAIAVMLGIRSMHGTLFLPDQDVLDLVLLE